MGQINPPNDLLARFAANKTKLEELKKAFKKSLKRDKITSFRDECEDYTNNPQGFWKFSKDCDPQQKQTKEPLVLKNKSGVELANHMKDYMHNRAHLVSTDVIKSHEKYIPMPSKTVVIHDTCRNEIKPRDIYFPPGKKPSLACGPDTISHRHIYDLFDA